MLILILGYIGNKLLDSLAGQVSDDLLAKLKGDPARKAFKKALGAAINRYSKLPGRLYLASALVEKRGFLQRDDVVAELGHIILFDRPPDAKLIGERWRAALPAPPPETDFTAEAGELVQLIAEELRGTDVFRPVFDAKRLDAIADHAATSDAALAQIGTQLGSIYELMNAKFDDVLRALAGPKIQEAVLDFSALISYLTAGFVGRQAVFDAVAGFMRENPRGYFEIRGDPGIGKSALAAKLVESNGYVHHFNVRAHGCNTSEAFLENICAQLIVSYDLPYQSLPDEAARDAGFLTRLLAEAAATLPGQPVVIVVDALDEVDDTAATAGRNPLQLPVTLPDGVYFVLTAQPAKTPLTIYGPHETYLLRADSPDNIADARAYVLQTLAESGTARAALASRQISEARFADDLIGKSEGSFIYLHYVLEDLIGHGADGALADLADLPAGLAAYYAVRWDLISGAAGDGWFDYLLPTVTVLAAAREAISISLLMTLTAIPDRPRVAAALNTWMPFLHSTEVPGAGKSQKRYRIFHASFLDFVAAQDEVDITDTHRRIAEILIAGLLPVQ
jgi:hypothetical protein